MCFLSRTYYILTLVQSKFPLYFNIFLCFVHSTIFCCCCCCCYYYTRCRCHCCCSGSNFYFVCCVDLIPYCSSDDLYIIFLSLNTTKYVVRIGVRVCNCLVDVIRRSLNLLSHLNELMSTIQTYICVCA